MGLHPVTTFSGRTSGIFIILRINDNLITIIVAIKVFVKKRKTKYEPLSNQSKWKRLLHIDPEPVDYLE